MAQHVLDEVHAPVAGRLRPDETAAVGEPLAGQHAVEAAGDAPVLPEEKPDLATTHADVARGHVDVVADVAIELGHERLTEALDFGVGLALRIEIRSALRAAHRQARQAVLEDLFEAEKLQDRQIDRRMKSQAALVRADRVAELHAIPAIDLDAARIVEPRHAEDDDPIGLGEPIENARLLVLGTFEHERHQGFGDFPYRLVKLRLVRTALGELRHEVVDGLGGLARTVEFAHLGESPSAADPSALPLFRQGKSRVPCLV